MSFDEERYSAGLAQEQKNSQSENAKENILKFYNDPHNVPVLEQAYNYYTEYETDKNKYVVTPKRIGKKAFKSLLGDKCVLVLTANPIERGVFLRWLSQKQGSPLNTYLVDALSYNVFQFSDDDSGDKTKRKSIIHLSPGGTGVDPTRKAINKACQIFTPSCICALGICFGFDRHLHKIGDVFISERLTVYRINFRDSEEEEKRIIVETETEAVKQPSSSLIRTIRGRQLYTQFQSIFSHDAAPTFVSMTLGDFLSTNSLVSNKHIKEQLFEQYASAKPKPLGGEMEGAAILSSTIVDEKDYCRWLIIKSVCDWGEMKNALDNDEETNKKIKDSLQAFAMGNSCGVFEAILEDLWEE